MFPSDGDVTMVALAGDWHENHWRAQQVIRAVKNSADVIIHIGDFGFYSTQLSGMAHYLDVVNNAAQEADLTLLVLDGNHEEHPWLLEHPLDDDGVRPIRDRILHLPRGFRWEWLGVRFLAMGGAHSINRLDLAEGISWWREERITQSDIAYGITGSPGLYPDPSNILATDVLLTHEAPEGVVLPGLAISDSNWPYSEVFQSKEQRALLGHLADAVNPHTIVHGHHHVRLDGIRPGPDGDQQHVISLASDREPLTQNYLTCSIFDLAQR